MKLATTAVVIISGGMDSSTLLWDLATRHTFDVICALSFDYNQRHKKELKCAQKICAELKIAHKVVDITKIGNQLLQGSSLTTASIDVPEGHYEEESMKLTVVPNRNMIMLSLAIGYAVSIKAEAVYYGSHAGDHAIYPDCRPEFVEAMRVAARLCDWHSVDIRAPYSHMDKGDIASRGISIGVPYKNTWTCYKGQEFACGKCGACSERILAFHKAGAKDPVEYSKPWNEVLGDALEMLKKGNPNG